MNRRFLATVLLGLLVVAPLLGAVPAAAGGAPPTPQAAQVPIAVTAVDTLDFGYDVVEAAYSPDGRFLAVAVQYGPVVVLNATDHSHIVNLTTAPNWISPSSLSWSPASDKLAAGYTGGAVAVWRIPSGLWAWTKSGLFYEVQGVSWSPDGRFLAAGIVNSVFIYTGESGSLNATMHMNYGGSQPAGLSWSHDSEYIAVGQQAYSPQGALLVVFTSSNWGKALQSRWDGPLMDEVAFEGRARFLSVQLGGSRVEVWSVKNWTQYASLATTTGVEQSAWTYDGSRLVMLERAPSAGANTTEDFGGFEVLRVGGGTGDALALAASPDGRRVAVGHSDGTLEVLAIGSDRFFDDRTPLRATTGEPLTFSVRYTGSAAAAVHWRDASGARTGSAGLALDGGRLNYTLDVPGDWDGPLFYHFEAPSSAVASPERLVEVADNDPPLLLDFNFTRVGPNGETAVGQVAFSDNLEVDSSLFSLSIDGVRQASASGGGTDTLNFTLSVPVTPQNASVRLDLDAVDPSGNGGRLLSQTFVLDDRTAPAFGADLSLPGTAGGRIQLGVEATDERGPPVVTMTWRELTATTESDWQNVTFGVPAVGSDDYILSLPVARETVAVEYSFLARDTAGNTNQTGVLFQTVRDVVPPEVVLDLSDREALQGRPFNLSIIARDNVGVASVKALVQEDGGQTLEIDLARDDNTAPGAWFVVHNVDVLAKTLSYQFVVTDEEGNSIYWGYRLMQVRDLVPPQVVALNPSLRVLAGDDYTLQLEGTDNDAVDTMVLYYSRNCAGPYFSWQLPVGTPAPTVRTSVFLADLNISTEGDGRPICLYVIAKDVTGNAGGLGAAQDPQVVQVLDGGPPDAQFVMSGQPYVGHVVTFDGSLSSDDLGIVEWEWKLDGEVVGNRSVLEWRFTEAGTKTVTLTVRDAAGGEDTSSLDVPATPPGTTSTGFGDVMIVGVVAAVGTAAVAGFYLVRRRPPEDGLVER